MPDDGDQPPTLLVRAALRAGPGTTLVLTAPADTPRDEVARMAEQLRARMPGVGVLVLGGGIDLLAVVSALPPSVQVPEPHGQVTDGGRALRALAEAAGLTPGVPEASHAGLPRPAQGLVEGPESVNTVNGVLLGIETKVSREGPPPQDGPLVEGQKLREPERPRLVGRARVVLRRGPHASDVPVVVYDPERSCPRCGRTLMVGEWVEEAEPDLWKHQDATCAGEES